MNFLNFVKSKNENINQDVNESFKKTDLDKAHALMLNIFKEKISKKVFSWDWLDTKIDDKDMKSYYFISLDDPDEPVVWALNYLSDKDSTSVYSISFFDVNTSKNFLWGNSNSFKASLNISTLGTSVAYFIPIICHVVKNGQYSLSKDAAIKIGNEIFNKGKVNEFRIYNFGNQKYRIFENLDNNIIDSMFFVSNGYTEILEASEAQEYRWKKKAERDEAKRNANISSEHKELYKKLDDEYRQIINAIRGGATTINEINMSISTNKSVVVKQDTGSISASEAIKNTSKDPKQAFKEMQVYVKTVISGLQPGVILCGAPGIGKTYRVLKQLEAAGYKDGYNMEIIKGKCTPRQLYLALYEYQEKGKIVVIDDADALVGPKAPEDCINMLKAALDSTSTDNGRKVSYKVSGKILDDEGLEIPKTIYYNGGVIVITNYSVGQIDTALRGRTFVQSLDFTTDQLLDIISELMSAIDPIRLTESSKEKALNYLKELSSKGSKMEISVRSFTTCAKLFAVCEDDPEMTDDDVKSMIKEQTTNMAMRGGTKF